MSNDKAQLVSILEKLINSDDSVNGIKTALEALETRFTAQETKVSELAASHPVMHIQINDFPEVKLKQRAHPKLPKIVSRSRAGLYSMLVGPAGCGKSTLAEQVAESLGLEYSYVNLTQGASETWLFGRQTPTGFFEGPFAARYRMGGVFLADELDAADANLLLSINTALSGKRMLNPMNGEVIEKHKDFIFLAASNTNGLGATHQYSGRVRLDQSTLDRLIQETVTYDHDLERELCPNVGMYNYLQKLRAQLIERKHDELISTRAFVSAFKQLAVGLTFKDIVNSLTVSWSESARELAWKLESVYQDASSDTETQQSETTQDAGTAKRGRGRPRKFPQTNSEVEK